MGDWLVLYDRDCGLCNCLLAWLLRWDRGRRLRPLALQRTEAAVLVGDLTAEQRMASWHLIEPGGTRHSAGEALAPLVSLLPGGAPLAALLTRFPGLASRGYCWIAEHRALLSRPIPTAAKLRAAELVCERERLGS